MTKDKVKFVCENCGLDLLKWQGKCPGCKQWGTLKEFKESKVKNNRSVFLQTDEEAKPLLFKDIKEQENNNLTTGFKEFDRVLGKGIIAGMAVLIGGDPGIGKSTLLLQLAINLAQSEKQQKILYVTAEESAQQIKQRFNRITGVDLDLDNLLIYTESMLGKIISNIISFKPMLIIIDSIQTIYDSSLESTIGSQSQLKEVASKVISVIKKYNLSVFFIGHITKDGIIAGPKVVEHMVDTVLYFEGDKYYNYRILRSIKNRFGQTNELGIFQMTHKGLAEIKNPSKFFLGENNQEINGYAISAINEGSRTFLVEIQALVTPTSYGMPQRNSVGYNVKRLNKIIAVLEKRIGLNFGTQDIFLNVAGGMKIDDPSSDFAVTAALMSSLTNRNLDKSHCFIGEIGLGGEIRLVSAIKSRINECEKIGFTKIFIPFTKENIGKNRSEIIKIKHFSQFIDYYFN